MKSLIRFTTLLHILSFLILSTGCGMLFLGNETWITEGDWRWGPINSGDELVCVRSQPIQKSRSGGGYLSPFGNKPTDALRHLHKGEALKVQKLRLSFSGTSSSSILYLTDRDGVVILLDTSAVNPGDLPYNQKRLARMGFKLRKRSTTNSPGREAQHSPRTSSNQEAIHPARSAW